MGLPKGLEEKHVFRSETLLNIGYSHTVCDTGAYCSYPISSHPAVSFVTRLALLYSIVSIPSCPIGSQVIPQESLFVHP